MLGLRPESSRGSPQSDVELNERPEAFLTPDGIAESLKDFFCKAGILMKK
jgi:hypothetical protein